MTEAEKIAAGLHPDQQDLLLMCPPRWFVAADLSWSRAVGATGNALMRLSERGVLERASDTLKRGRSKYRLTPLGLEVRKLLDPHS